MKPSILSFLVAAWLIAAPSRVDALARIAIYSDAALSDCTLSDGAPVIRNIYVAEHSDEATALRFRVVASPGFTGTWVAETSPFYVIGTSPVDVSIGFGRCMQGQFLVLTMTYQMFGTSTCSELSIAAAPGLSQPICIYCSFHELPCSGYGSLHVNCSGTFECNPLATEPVTWGRVKALYRD
jgi:hypothetical protein